MHGCQGVIQDIEVRGGNKVAHEARRRLVACPPPPPPPGIVLMKWGSDSRGFKIGFQN